MTTTVALPVVFRKNWISVLIFLYFFTTSADLLNIKVSLFHCKVNHALSFFLFLIFSMHKKRWIIPEKKIFFAFLATIVAMGVSAILGVYPYRSFIYLFVYVFTFLAYFLLPLNLVLAYGKETIFKLYFASFIATGIVGSLQFFLSFFGIVAPFVTQFMVGIIARGQAMTYEPSYYALFLVPYVMYYNARFLFDSEKILDFTKLNSLFWKNLLLLVSTSTGAFFAYFIFFIVVFFVSCSRWVKEYRVKVFSKLFKVIALFILLFTCIAIAMPQLFLKSFWKFFDVGFMNHSSFVERLFGIFVAWDIFLHNPLFGVGIGGLGPLVYQQCFSSGETMQIHEPYSCMFQPFDPTNAFSELLGSLGIIGLLAFGRLFFLYFRFLHQTAKLTFLSKEEKSTIYGLVVSIGVMLIVLQFNQNLFRSYVWVHLAICLGYCLSLRMQYGKPENKPPPSS